jgi:hypothetical protein
VLLTPFLPRYNLTYVRKLLIRLLGGHLSPPEPGEPHADIVALTARVGALEELQTRRELEWAEVSEKLLRYVKRISAVEARAQQREEGSAATDPVTIALLRSKYPHANGG